MGRRHKVTPRQIVGALANEGGLSSSELGRIEIRADHSLVELPVELAPSTLDRLSGTRISGRLIELQPDDGPPRGGRPGRDSRGSRDTRERKGGSFQRKGRPRS